ncbi:MAG TPA: flagellar filament capping protein FliD, partial [Gemmatimonadales bacterium]|nr:flagellar filament capping protein FliD [Gemmatimonadales bacterium]
MADSLSAVTGLSSGIDYRSLVDAIIAAEHRTADAAQTQIDLANKRQEAVKSWRTLMTTFRTALDKVRDIGGALDTFLATAQAQSTAGRTLFTATASSTAQPGSYAIEVRSVARSEKLGSRAVADVTAALGLDGSFVINGATVSVTAADSLTAIRDKINAANAGTTPTRVAASILTVGRGDSRLVLTSQVSGAAGIGHGDSTGGVLANLELVGGNEYLVTGRDADFVIDGVPMTRSSNVVSDAISGVTLTLQAEEEGTVGTLDVTRDGAAAGAAVKAVVEAYNAAVRFIREQGAAGATKPPLYGDPMLRLARSSFSRGFLGVIAGDDGNAVTGSVAGLSLSKTGE